MNDPARTPDVAMLRWLEELPEERRLELGRTLADRCLADGLTIFRPGPDGAEGRFQPIAVALTPEVIDPAVMGALGDDAGRLLAATYRLARHTYTPAGRPLAELLYAAFTPLEHRTLAADPARMGDVAIARIDYFFAAEGHRALEINATIPAMPGYSDVVAHRWIEVVGEARGLSPARIAELVAAAGSNADDALASLLAHYRRLGGRVETPSILCVCRRGDSQLAELAYLARRFTAAGHRSRHAFADEITVDDRGRALVDGEPFDLVYRHIFARRLDPSWPFARLLETPVPGGTIVLNPIDSPLEVKAMLALLHEAGADPDRARTLGLTDEDLDVVRRVVPWTRLLAPGPATLPDGDRVPDLVAWASAHGDRLVLKRSWDYGGKSVHVGPDSDGWEDLVRRAADEPGAWVLQEYVTAREVRHLLVERARDEPAVPRWRSVYVDVSAYTNHGIDVRYVGGVCRAAGTKVVNLAGGGGLAPLVPSPVVAALLT